MRSTSAWHRRTPRFSWKVSAGSTGEHYIIDDYPEYGNELTPAQRARLTAIARMIVESHMSTNGIIAVVVVGPCRHASRLPVHERAKKEEEVSHARADSGLEQLQLILMELTRHNGAARGRVQMMHYDKKWRGAKFATHADVKKNRRIVIQCARGFTPPALPPAPLPPPGPRGDPENDPNVVYAGTRFRMKILDQVGGSLGPFGLTSVTLAIWDVGNSRAAAYEYTAGSVGLGFGGFDGGDSYWSDFTLTKPLQVDQFAGSAGHESVSVGITGKFTIHINHTTPRVTCKFMAPSKSIGTDSSAKGNLTRVPGTMVQVYNDAIDKQ